MADTAVFPYRLAVGWITKAALEASSSYLLTAFPLQSDQVSLFQNPWGPPDDDLTTFPVYARYGQYADETQWADGKVKFRWGHKYFTEIMQYYWENLIFGSSFATQSAQVTVKTRRAADSNAFAVYQCYANRAKPNVDYKRGFRGVDDYITEFVAGAEITS